MSNNKAAKIAWIYTAVQHTDHVAVHRTAYSGPTPVATALMPETLTDVTPEHLFDFVSHVANGLANCAVISQADFLRLSAEYDVVNAADQAAVEAEEMAIA